MRFTALIPVALVGLVAVTGCGNSGSTPEDKTFFNQLQSAAAKNKNPPKTRNGFNEKAPGPGQKPPHAEGDKAPEKGSDTTK